ncbi:hypothetical protein BU204_29085 [Actinophytocola xanthii]|uniref:Uncharacterized protein n=1 Tax=Actinophytocola xanthii TaxID=1912961 RepID=A0A1Q8CDN1_9PSEU|nr:hypothetical protein BU204_29085 [Actinophytocola xanthii]
MAFLSAGLLIVGPVVGVVEDPPAAGYASTPLLVLLAAAAPVLALVLVQRGRALTGAAVLTGAGLLAPGRALVDLVFLRDGLSAARPEFLVPTTLADLRPAAGLWLLLAGHLAAAVAGVLAAGRAGAAPGSPYALELDESTTSVGSRRRALGWALAFATIAVVGLVMAPFQSDNAFLLDDDMIGASTLVGLGTVLIAVAVLGGCVYAAGAARSAVSAGVLLGVLVATAAVALPQIVAGLTVDLLRPAPGPYLALISLVLLTGLIVSGRAGRERERGTAELTLEAGRVHLVTGVLGVLTGVASLIGAFGPQVTIEALDSPETYANRPLVPAGILVGSLGAALLYHRWAATVRPAFVVSLGAVVLVGASTLDAAFTGAGIGDDIHIGAGAWFAAVAVVLAAAAAVSGAVAGSTERDDVDLTERTVHTSVAAPVAAAILFSVGAFGLPMFTARDFVAPGIWTEFRLASWGLLIAMCVVIAASVIAAMARPARAAALLLGAAAVVGVHALEFPLTGDRAQDATAGSGTWLSLACCLALLVAAGIASAGPAPEHDEKR